MPECFACGRAFAVYAPPQPYLYDTLQCAELESAPYIAFDPESMEILCSGSKSDCQKFAEEVEGEMECRVTISYATAHPYNSEGAT
jgi:hypothetical protein